MKREREEDSGKEGGGVRHCSGLMNPQSSPISPTSAAATAATTIHHSGSSNGASGGDPDSKSRKYDRQLRIWGEHGQAALERASICLLNCGATGSEALKNLVLGGVGSVTLVDAAVTQERDLGNNFLLRYEDLGQPRAKCMATLLREMNDQVIIHHVESSPEDILVSDPGFFSTFTLIIATQMRERSLITLDELSRRNSVMLLVARSYGLAGYVRASLKEHTIIESKPDHLLDDLRLHKPWPELARLAQEFDINTRDSIVHKHIPFAIILLKLCEEWRSKHEGKLPVSNSERSELRELLLSKKQGEDEDNYKEALAALKKVWAPPGISSEVRAILDDPEVEVGSSDFWVLVAGLKRFISEEGGGDLPLDGSIPDMHSFTEYYIQLQACYQAKAEVDISAVESHTRAILKSLGRDPGSITRASVKHFCKNSRNLRVLRFSSLAEEFNPGLVGSKVKRFAPFEGENVNYALWVLFRGVDKFWEGYGRFPGAGEVDDDGEFEEDAVKLRGICGGIVRELGVEGGGDLDDLVHEFCRFGAGEIHCVGAVVGGIASQEAIKLVTRQFAPAAGTLIYNAISSTSTVLQL